MCQENTITYYWKFIAKRNRFQNCTGEKRELLEYGKPFRMPVTATLIYKQNFFVALMTEIDT